MASTVLLALDGISKKFGLVGDNGAGKSTLVKTIAGIHTADSGSIRFSGDEVSITRPQDATGLGIATVYQDLALCDNLDVVANVFLGHEEISPGLGTVSRSIDEVSMEHQAGELLSGLAVTIPSLRS